MAYESLDDVLEQIADWCGVYGACSTTVEGCSADPKCCRSGFVAELKFRILRAVQIDAALAATNREGKG